MTVSSLDTAEQPANWDTGEFMFADPARLGGEPVFRGTRVPVKALFEYLRAGDSLAVFLDHFPGVRREHAEAAIASAGWSLLEHAARP